MTLRHPMCVSTEQPDRSLAARSRASPTSPRFRSIRGHGRHIHERPWASAMRKVDGGHSRMHRRPWVGRADSHANSSSKRRDREDRHNARKGKARPPTCPRPRARAVCARPRRRRIADTPGARRRRPTLQTNANNACKRIRKAARETSSKVRVWAATRSLASARLDAALASAASANSAIPPNPKPMIKSCPARGSERSCGGGGK